MLEKHTKRPSKPCPLGSFVIKDIPENLEDEVIYLSPFLTAHA
jgi:hypothetical protein